METTLSYIFKVSHEPGRVIKTHQHSTLELVLYINANGKTRIGEREYPVKTGDLAVIHAETPHSEEHFKNARVFCLAFYCSGSLLPPQGVYKTRAFERLHALFQQIYSEINRKDAYSKVVTSALCEVVSVTVLRDLFMKTEPKTNIELIANYLRENYFVPDSLQKIAADFGCDYDYFRHEFKKIYKVSPKQYIMNTRLLNAYNMLNESNCSCTDIAMRCGFSDSAQFSKLFRIKYGFSPTNLKKQIRSGS